MRKRFFFLWTIWLHKLAVSRYVNGTSASYGGSGAPLIFGDGKSLYYYCKKSLSIADRYGVCGLLKAIRNKFILSIYYYLDRMNLQFRHLTDSACIRLSPRDTTILRQPHTRYDVIFLAIIDFTARYQRPQHFASHFAGNGHRVFYINASFSCSHQGKPRQIKKNLFVTDLYSAVRHDNIYNTSWSNSIWKNMFTFLISSNAISDAVVVVEYPNWLPVAEYLREQYGFKIILDYLDDFTDFKETANKRLIRNTEKLLASSDLVIASGNHLHQLASRFNERVEIVRNGAQVDHFMTAFGQPASPRVRPVLGYFGAIADWFDADLIVYLAEHLPDCDIELVGNVQLHQNDTLMKYRNIKLLGEQPYSSLPDYLKNFDVCLIPFDASRDLIKSTNPVKFYEYLSAGKKIVATNIPELQEYRDKYVYLADDYEQFLHYVRLCILGDDALADAQTCVTMAAKHDWRLRFNDFNTVCSKTPPSVSLIVLTYNQLDYTRICLESLVNTTAYPNFELIIVDNNSTDGTRNFLKTFQEIGPSYISIILNDENLGFAAGNNVGIKAAQGNYIVLLNNDVIVTRGWLSSLIKHLENDSGLGICGPVTNAIGNESKIAIRYNSLKSMRKAAYSYTRSHMNQLYQGRIKSLAMFCLAIRRQCLDECGLLDERFQVGMFEDDDYSQTVKQAGWRLGIAEDSFVHHFGSASFNALNRRHYLEIFEKNRLIFDEKWAASGVKWEPHTYRPGVTAAKYGSLNLTKLLKTTPQWSQ